MALEILHTSILSDGSSARWGTFLSIKDNLQTFALSKTLLLKLTIKYRLEFRT